MIIFNWRQSHARIAMSNAFRAVVGVTADGTAEALLNRS
jgi:hypothetical protein